MSLLAFKANVWNINYTEPHFFISVSLQPSGELWHFCTFNYIFPQKSELFFSTYSSMVITFNVKFCFFKHFLFYHGICNMFILFIGLCTSRQAATASTEASFWPQGMQNNWVSCLVVCTISVKGCGDVLSGSLWGICF